MTTPEMTFVYDGDSPRRVDLFLAGKIIDYSRNTLQGMIENGLVLVNTQPTKSHYRLKIGDLVTVKAPPDKTTRVLGENIPLDIIYEDQDLVVLNKKRGMVVHPATSHESGTLVNALVYHFKSHLSQGTEVRRPGIVHRLDMGTSGLLLVCKTDRMQLHLSRAFAARKIEKYYQAIVSGVFEVRQGRIEYPIKRESVNRKKMGISADGKSAVTLFTVKEAFPGFSLLDLQILTGRTHQIRVHLSHLGHPVLNDEMYGYRGEKLPLDGQALHAQRIIFEHPFLKKTLDLVAPLPADMTSILDKLRNP
ncbi:MAG: RluA family pseudouridine synthase [Candidatus Wallbacteria bacterium]|nr:RluA family pseudouridine synthase [Candidatus Wallbacteria bacterium]